MSPPREYIPYAFLSVRHIDAAAPTSAVSSGSPNSGLMSTRRKWRDRIDFRTPVTSSYVLRLRSGFLHTCMGLRSVSTFRTAWQEQLALILHHAQCGICARPQQCMHAAGGPAPVHLICYFFRKAAAGVESCCVQVSDERLLGKQQVAPVWYGPA
jgi:hypothetical protein